MTDIERFWILDAANEHNKIAEAIEATGLPLVGLVDEKVGGVVAYVTEQDGYADKLARMLNAS